MTAFNVVQFRVKPGREQEFLNAHQNVQTDWPRLRKVNMIKSGARAWMFSQVDRALETTKTEINLLTKKLAAPQVDSTLRARSSGLEGKMSHLVHNEQMKLAANLFNNLAVVSLASGILVPISLLVPAPHPSASARAGTLFSAASP
jgi:hypothetical protein